MSTRRDLMMREICTAASRLFHERGIVSVSLQEIASEVGLSKAALYHYFDTKEDLVRFIFSGWAASSKDPFEEIAASNGSPEEKLGRIVSLRIEQMVSDFDLFVLSIREETELPENVRSEFNRTKRDADRIVRDIIVEGQSAEGFKRLDPHLIEFALMGMCNWLWKWYSPEGEKTPTDIAEAFTEILLHGVVRDRPEADEEPPPRSTPLDRALHHANAIARHSESLDRTLAELGRGDER